MAIPGWDISVPGVRSALAKTIAAIQPMEGHAERYADAMWNAGYASGSDRVKAALASFGEHHEYTIPLVFKRTSNCIRGATLATNAYVTGDEQMAEQAQRNARAAPTVADLKKSLRGGGDR